MPEKIQIEVFLRILMTLKNEILKNTIFGIRKTSHFKCKGLDLFYNKRCTSLDENSTRGSAHKPHTHSISSLITQVTFTYWQSLECFSTH